MDCNLSQLLLSLARGDRGVDDQAALDRHLTGCAACSALAKRLSAFDAAVASAMVAVPVPPTLRDNLLKAAYTRQGAAWRRTVYRCVGLAAAVLLTVGLISGGAWRLRPVADGTELTVAAENAWEFREATVRDWLVRQDLPAEFPAEADFDLRLSTFHGKGDLAGREVPVVIFQNGPEQARVYIVRESQLNTRELRAAEGSVWKVAVAAHPTARGLTYVVLYTNALEPFLRRPLSGPL